MKMTPVGARFADASEGATTLTCVSWFGARTTHKSATLGVFFTGDALLYATAQRTCLLQTSKFCAILFAMETALRSESARRTQAERTALSDRRMLAAAISLVCERGATATTLKEVGERAGYSRGLASHRFGSKPALYSFIIRAVGEEWLHELRGAVQERVGLAAIHAATDAHYRFVREAPDRIRAFYMLWFDSIGPHADLQEVISNIHARRQRDVEAWIRDGIAAGEIDNGIDVARVAEQFCAAIIGIVYQWLVAPESEQQIEALHEGLKQQMTLALNSCAQHTHGTAGEHA